MTIKYCFACGKPLKGKVYFADCEDGQKNVMVGPGCYKQIKACKDPIGWIPPQGGPALFPAKAT